MSIIGKGALLALALVATPAAAQEALTTRGMEALTGEAANKAVQADLLSILKPATSIRPTMSQRIQEVGLETRPVGTEFEGLCRQDVLVLSYAPTDTAPQPLDQPLRPTGLETIHSFHAMQMPKAAGQVWAADCAALASRGEVTWFRAADARQAAEGVRWLMAAVDQVRAGALHVADCPKDAKTGCDKRLLQVGRVGDIGGVEACQADAGQQCLVVTLADFTEVVLVGRPGADGALEPASLSRVAIEED